MMELIRWMIGSCFDAAARAALPLPASPPRSLPGSAQKHRKLPRGAALIRSGPAPSADPAKKNQHMTQTCSQLWLISILVNLFQHHWLIIGQNVHIFSMINLFHLFSPIFTYFKHFHLWLSSIKDLLIDLQFPSVSHWHQTAPRSGSELMCETVNHLPGSELGQHSRGVVMN